MEAYYGQYRDVAHDWFENLEEDKKVNLWNDYCDDNKYYNENIYNLDGYMLECFFGSIEEFAKSVSISSHFDYNDRYFKVRDVYNDILTDDHMENLADVDSDFFDWLLEKYQNNILKDKEMED